ncbi:MAG TPA: hypothetical protein VFO63_08465 [Blastocatellia bacterium]|nr:hypothetical protein [Blastocatellia bacterium]
MAIILYSKKKFHGNAISVNNDVADLKDSGLKGAPSSLSITAAGDRVLLFKRKDFDGACLFRQGKAQIEDLGDNDAGGKFGFGNTIASVRLNAFSVDINATFIKNAGGELPGGLAKTKDAEHLAEQAVIEASRLWEPFLMRLKLASVEFQTDDMHFDVELDRLVRFPLSFYKKNHVNVFFINSFRKALGITRPACLGEAIALTLTKDGAIAGKEILGCTLAHEFGHHVGIHHPGAKNNPTNIMNCPLVYPLSSIRDLSDEQVSDAHTCLARNPARRGQQQG